MAGEDSEPKKNVFRISGTTFYNQKNKIPMKNPEFKKSGIGLIVKSCGIPNGFPNQAFCTKIQRVGKDFWCSAKNFNNCIWPLLLMISAKFLPEGSSLPFHATGATQSSLDLPPYSPVRLPCSLLAKTGMYFILLRFSNAVNLVFALV